jgi:hypothetical protein
MVILLKRYRKKCWDQSEKETGVAHCAIILLEEVLGIKSVRKNMEDFRAI